MKLRFWGVRGSIPTPGPNTQHYGGNTSCLQFSDDGEPMVILDAGTGIRGLGMDLLKRFPNNKEIHLFFSHTHWDHIQGLPFFAPLYVPGYKIKIYGPVHYEKSLEEILERQMEYTYFPVRVAELAAELTYRELKEEEFNVGGYKVKSKYLNHPVLCLGYRFEKNGKVLVYCTDHEPYYNFLEDEETEDEMNVIVQEQNNRLVEFVRGADLLVLDTQYTKEEYPSHIGWGHSSTNHSIDIAIRGGVKRYALFHHDPDRTDERQTEIVEDLQKNVNGPMKEIFSAREGLEIDI
ncbi:MAG: MBL fold metallo-hydrolase [Nitrospinota bacterium]